MAAYRITPEKAERAWVMPDKPQVWFENHMGICATRRALIRDGRVYLVAQKMAAGDGGTSRPRDRNVPCSRNRRDTNVKH